MVEKRSASEDAALTKSQQLDAISWAAKKAGMSYGKYSSTLTEEDKTRIYAEYAQLLAAKRRKEQKRLATLGRKP